MIRSGASGVRSRASVAIRLGSLLPCGSGTGWFGWCSFRSRAEVDAGLAAHGAIDDGRLALDPGAEQALEQLGLGRAQVGQLGGQVLHRAVVLAEPEAAVGGLDLGHEALLVQDLGQGVGPLGKGSAFHPSGVAGRQPLVPPGQELGQGGRVLPFRKASASRATSS